MSIPKRSPVYLELRPVLRISSASIRKAVVGARRTAALEVFGRSALTTQSRAHDARGADCCIVGVPSTLRILPRIIIATGFQGAGIVGFRDLAEIIAGLNA